MADDKKDSFFKNFMLLFGNRYTGEELSAMAENAWKDYQFKTQLDNDKVWDYIVELVSTRDKGFLHSVRGNPEVSQWAIVCWLVRLCTNLSPKEIERRIRAACGDFAGPWVDAISLVFSVEKCIERSNYFRDEAIQLQQAAKQLILDKVASNDLSRI